MCGTLNSCGVGVCREERVLVRFFEEAERLAQDEQRKLEPTEHTLEFSIERLRELNKR